MAKKYTKKNEVVVLQNNYCIAPYYECFWEVVIRSWSQSEIYLAIIPRARMGSESIAMRPKGEWAIDSEAMRARRIIIVLVNSN